LGFHSMRMGERPKRQQRLCQRPVGRKAFPIP
jgi:hypothetical protein